MTCVIRFTTTLFDVTRERPNPINPIHGESLLLWLRERAQPLLVMTGPDAEDWGWYSSVTWNGRSYLLGASASDEDGDEHEWVLQIIKDRSFTEKLLGREKMQADDGCARHFQELLEQEPQFRGLTVDTP